MTALLLSSLVGLVLFFAFDLWASAVDVGRGRRWPPMTSQTKGELMIEVRVCLSVLVLAHCTKKSEPSDAAGATARARCAAGGRPAAGRSRGSARTKS